MRKHIIIGILGMFLIAGVLSFLLDHETPEDRKKRIRLMEALSPMQNLYIHTDQDITNYELERLKDSIRQAKQ